MGHFVPALTDRDRARARPWAATSAQTRPDISGRASPTLKYFGLCRA
jgi:ribosomal protein S14